MKRIVIWIAVKPEQFVKVLKTFDLPDGISPASWASPDVDPFRIPRALD
ncbi:MAG: hypothetical protein ABSC60_17170 [Acidobacteriota bacterium]|jgi:hypothetical protein